MPRLVLDDLCRSFPAPGGQVVRAIDQVNLVVEPGELLVLTGPSGCGKTTTLRLIAGLEAPDSGTITLDEKVINNLPPRARDVAMVFQRPALYPHMSVAENIGFGLRTRNCPRLEMDKRVAEAAELLGLQDCLDRLPMELSGGQQQRAALGRALVRRAGLLLLDEPLSNLDAPLRNQMRQELARIHARWGTTSIHVTHDQQEALGLGERIAVMNQGRILEVAPPEQLYSRPGCLFTARFIGFPPMNLLPGRIVTRETALVFQLDVGGSAAPLALTVQAGRVAALQKYAGRPLVLGIRPENIRVDVESVLPGDLWTCKVEAIEFAGAENFVRLSAAGATLVARLPAPAAARPGEIVRVSFGPETMLFYDAETQQLVSP